MSTLDIYALCQRNKTVETAAEEKEHLPCAFPPNRGSCLNSAQYGYKLQSNVHDPHFVGEQTGIVVTESVIYLFVPFVIYYQENKQKAVCAEECQ